MRWNHEVEKIYFLQINICDLFLSDEGFKADRCNCLGLQLNIIFIQSFNYLSLFVYHNSPELNSKKNSHIRKLQSNKTKNFTLRVWNRWRSFSLNWVIVSALLCFTILDFSVKVWISFHSFFRGHGVFILSVLVCSSNSTTVYLVTAVSDFSKDWLCKSVDSEALIIAIVHREFSFN